MGVPDTDTFKLSDVRTELGLSAPTKQSVCFANAAGSLFDPAYVGNKDRLSNFRNYKASGSLILHDEFLGTGVIYQQGSVSDTFNDVRTKTSGILNTTHPPEIWVDYVAGKYWIWRQFIRFDLTGINSLYSCTAARIEWKQTNTFGTNLNVACLFSGCGSSLVTGDYDNFTFNDYAFSGAQSTYTDNCSQTGRRLYAQSGELADIAAKFGGYLNLVLINAYHDNSNSSPSSKQGIEGWSSGEVVTGCIYEPLLTVSYN